MDSTSPTMVPDSDDPESTVPAITLAPSSASLPSTLPPLRPAKAVTKTYARRTPLVPVPAESHDASSIVASDRSSPATVIVPETDPDAEIEPELGNGDLESGSEDEGSARGERASTRRRDSSASILTTDPTSEEELASTTVKAPIRAVDVDSDSDSDASMGAVDDEDAPPIFQRRSIKDLMADIDNASSDDDDTGPALMHLGPISAPATATALGPSSPLTSLVDSSVQLASTQPLPLSQNGDPSALVDDSDDSQVVKPSAKRRKRQVVASDSDSDEPAQAQPSRRATVVPSSDLDADSAPVLSKRDKILALAAKRAPPPKDEPARASGSGASAISSDDEEDRKVKAKRPRLHKGLTKKGEDEVHREAAALQRASHARLQPRTKQQVSVSSVVSRTKDSFVTAPTHMVRPSGPLVPLSGATKFSFGAPPPVARSPHARMTPVTLPPTSSSAIEDTSPQRPQLSEKAQGKQPARRSVQLPRPLVARVDAAPKPMPIETKAESSDTDEEFLSIDALIKLKADSDAARASAAAARAEAEAFQAKKLAAAAVEPVESASDSDSDIEILPPPSRGRTSTPRAALELESATPRLGATARKLDVLTQHHAHHDEDASESQIVNAGRAFGKDLSAPAHASLKPAPAASKKANSRGHVESRISRDELNQSLLQRTKQQNVATITKKTTLFRKAEDEKARLAREAAVPVDFAELLKQKDQKIKDEGTQAPVDEDDDGDDPDFEDAGEDVGESDAEHGSGSEGEAEAASEVDEAGSGVDETGSALDEDVQDAPREETPEPVVAVVHVEPLALTDDADFSDFFGTAFEAEVDQGPQGTGFAGFQQESQAEAPLYANALIDTAEQERDGAGLQQALSVLDTPAAVKPQFQQYINKLGMYTQTVQDTANLFEDSPSDTPRHGTAFSQIARTVSLADTESQALTPTQLEAQTPTQAPRNSKGLHRGEAIVPYSAYSLPAADVDAPTPSQTQDAEEPSAAQLPPIRNAFELLAMGAKAIAAPVLVPFVEERRKPKKSDFIQDEVDLDDEEDTLMGLGNLSGDEDEEGMDAELAELVDNEIKDSAIVEEEDALVEELRAEHEAAEELKREARAKAITEGKERLKRKNGGVDFSDDDFDDDGYGVSKRGEKRARVENKTMAQLEANEETQSFAAPLKEGLVVLIKDSDLDFLAQPEHSGSEDEGGQDGYAWSEGEEEDRPAPTTVKERKANERRLIEEGNAKKPRERSPSPRLYTGQSSSPAPRIKIKTKTASVVIEPGDLDSQYSIVKKYDSWKADSNEESQGAANGGRGGSTSAVTSFKTSNPRAKASFGGSLVAGSHGKTDVVPRQSKMGSFRKGGFAK